VPTTSRPQRRSKSSARRAGRDSPIKGVRLTLTLSGEGGADLQRLACGRGLTVEEDQGRVRVSLGSSTPEEALAELRLLADFLARRP
jgi:hypothetical protein